MTIHTNAAEQAARMRRNAQGVRAAAIAVTADFTKQLQADVRDRMGSSGLELSPGSELVASVETETFAGKNMIGGRVGSDRPESHRLEEGFVGTDSEGRHVAAPPYPAYKPAVDALAEPYRNAVETAVTEALRSD